MLGMPDAMECASNHCVLPSILVWDEIMDDMAVPCRPLLRGVSPDLPFSPCGLTNVGPIAVGVEGPVLVPTVVICRAFVGVRPSVSEPQGSG